MENFGPGTDPVVFIGICFAWLAIAFFFLGARKVYFEPFADKAEE